MRIGVALVVMVALASGSAAAEPAWRAARGTVAPGRLPGSLILASDAAPGRYSVGELVATAPVTLPYRFEVVWRRLGPEAGRSMHVLVAGGVVLIKAGRINFYAYDDAAFAAGDWQPVPDHRAHDEQVVVVTQDAREVVVTIDGRLAARFALATARADAHVGVGMKAAPGLRSKLYLVRLDVRPRQ